MAKLSKIVKKEKKIIQNGLAWKKKEKRVEV